MLKKLKQLAEAVRPVPLLNDYGDTVISEFIPNIEVNPQTILRMIAVMEEMAEALTLR